MFIDRGNILKFLMVTIENEPMGKKTSFRAISHPGLKLNHVTHKVIYVISMFRYILQDSIQAANFAPNRVFWFLSFQ